jgi:MYXO-CTERM domain-containing protein
MRRVTSLLLALALLALAQPGSAFCGFYVAGADAKLFNNATMVVMMRQGTRTVLSMQNNYQGPPENFAMVIPVPVVLQKENVKTLSQDVFARIDKLAAPRLVEYWEQDPCYVPPPSLPSSMASVSDEAATAGPRGGGVKIEAQFTVGEYEVVVLSASDSSGLDKWLRDNGYKIPDAAEPLLRPYVQEGSKFFVAKVDSSKVKFVDGQAKLSPLRFYYDTDKFNLPVRLGLVNSSGTQDLIVHILADSRYEVANYENVTIPTNIDLDESAKARFGEFYAALFDATLEKNPKAVVTEYVWQSSGCDPCPSPPLNMADLATLGGDALPTPPSPGMVITRLHARYGKAALGEDLVFRAATPIVGGREFVQKDGKLETGSQKSSINNFQGRYAIRHPWTGAIKCDKPVRGRWGGPPTGGKNAPQAALDTAFAPRGKTKLASFVEHDVSEIGLEAAAPSVPHAGAAPTSKSGSNPVGPVGTATTRGPAQSGGSCACTHAGAPRSGSTPAWWLLALVPAVALRRRATLRHARESGNPA